MSLSPEARLGLVLLAGTVALAAALGLAGASWLCGWLLTGLKGEWS